MTDIIFSPYLGWIDATDPANLPDGIRTITAADLLRYEAFGRDGAAAINALQNRQISTGTGLSGGGDLTADRSLSVVYGTAAGTAAQGNDTRITGAAQAANNLSDLASAATARTNLGLGNVNNTADADKPISTATQAALDALAKGLAAISELTAATAAATGLAVATTIPSFTFAAGRWYEIAFTAGVYNTTGAQNSALAQLWSASTADAANATTGLTELMGYNIISPAANITTRVNVIRKIKFATTTTLQIKATINGMGVGSYVLAAGATYPAQLTVTDLGKQF